MAATQSQRAALADTRRIQAALGWAPATDVATGLAAQVAWQMAEHVPAAAA